MEKKIWTEEADVGITEYLHPELKPIKGTIKARYSDFVVNEIDIAGHVSYISKAEVEKKVEPAKEKEEVKKSNVTISEEFKSKLKDLMKSESFQSLIEFIENIGEGIIPNDSVFQFPCTNMDKADRTIFHQLIKQHCPQFETNTVSLYAYNI